MEAGSEVGSVNLALFASQAALFFTRQDVQDLRICSSGDDSIGLWNRSSIGAGLHRL